MTTSPASPPDRIASLDVIRGLAVLGILPVNAPYFAASWRHAINPTLPPLDVHGPTLWAWAIPHIFFEAKFITLFSMLFGVSVYLVGGERGDLVSGGVLRRRLFWLAIFGLLHGALIWSGDILLIYAACGGMMLFCRSWSALRLIGFGAAMYAASVALNYAQGASLRTLSSSELHDLSEAIWAPSAAAFAAQAQAMTGGLASATRANFQEWTQFLFFGAPTVIPRTIALMMLGLGFFKIGFLSGAMRARVYAVALALGAIALAVIAAQAFQSACEGFSFPAMYAAGFNVNLAVAPFVSLGYAAALIRVTRVSALRWIKDALSAVGRMALTNYIAQSMVMTTIFWGGRGFGLFGAVDRVTLMGIVLALWCAIVLWSLAWLRFDRQGPLESVWRRLSYGAVRHRREG